MGVIRSGAEITYSDGPTISPDSPRKDGPTGIRALFGTVEDVIEAGDAALNASLIAETVAREDADTALSARVDQIESGRVDKDAVRVATTTAGTLATSFENGDTIDGIVLATNDRILIKDQSSGAENGIYVVQATGAPVRASDANANNELPLATVFVEDGTVNGGSTWKCTNETVTLDSTALVFVKIATGTLQSVIVSSGAPDSGKVTKLDPNGQLSYTVLPSLFNIIQDEGLLDSTGDGLRALSGVSDTAAAEQIGPWAAVVGDLARNPRLRPKVYLMGDSRCDLCSGDYQTETRGWLWWLGVLTGWRFDFQLAQNYGVGGTETYEVLAQALSLVGQEPGIVFGFVSTNDRTSVATVTQAVDTINTLTALQNVITNVGGHTLIWFADQPRGDGNAGASSAGLTGDNLGHHLHVAQWFREQRGAKGVYVADPWPALVNQSSSTAKAIDTVYYDGLHNGCPGAYFTALAAKPTIETLLPARSLLPATNYDTYTAINKSGNLIANGMMTGTSGTLSSGLGATPTGSLADGWTLEAGTGLTVAASKATDADGYDEQVIAVSGTASGASSGSGTNASPLDTDVVSAVLTYTLTDANLADGDVIEAVCRFRVDSGSSGLRGVPITVLTTGTGVAGLTVGGEPSMASNASFPNLRFPSVQIEGINRTPEFTIPAGYTAYGGSKSAKIKIAIVSRGGEAISATIRIGRVSVRKVRS